MLIAATRLGPYEIVAPLGAGGMGEVYRAKDPRLGREVAIKVLPAEFAIDPERLRRFEQEARAASALNHPNILTLFDVGRDGETSYLVTELLEGESLRDTLRRGSLSAERAVELALQIAHGLAAAHAKGVVHRDLKPENLFLTVHGLVKILDFGLARLAPPLASASQLAAAPTVEALTGPGAIVGTVGYMAPEQVRGEVADERADLFAFGCVLYELLSGRRAFARTSAIETCSAILRDEPPDLANELPGLSPALARVVRHCLEKRPDDRFREARDLLFALEQTISPAAAAPVRAPAPEATRRRRLLAAAAAAVAIVAAGAGIWFASRGKGGGPTAVREPQVAERSVAVLPFANLSGNADNDFLGAGLAEEIINVLARSGVRVVARTSAFAFQGRNVDVREIARQLNVSTVVEGSVRQAGERLRVTAQLVQAEDGFHLWSETFERTATDLFAVEDEIARAVLGIVTGGREGAALAPRAARDPEAHALYLRGLHEMRGWLAEGLARAEPLFESAVARDAGFCDAWATLADTVVLRYELHGVRERDAAYQAARAAARRALDCASPSADGHAVLSHILWHEHRWSEAEAEARKAVALAPSSAVAQEWLGTALLASGRLAEAEGAFRRAVEADPLAAPYLAYLAISLRALGNHDEAVLVLQRDTELENQGRLAARSAWLEVDSLVRLGRFDEARRRGDDRVARGKLADTLAAALRARVLAGRGDAAGARAELARWAPRGRECAETTAIPQQVMTLFLQLGERELAIGCFEQSARDRLGDFLAISRHQPEVQAALADPRMQALLREANLAGLPGTGPGTPPAR